MKKFIQSNAKGLFSIALIIAAFSAALITSMLLDVTFFKQHLVRQILVYIAITVQLLLAFKLILIINTKK